MVNIDRYRHFVAYFKRNIRYNFYWLNRRRARIFVLCLKNIVKSLLQISNHSRMRKNRERTLSEIKRSDVIEPGGVVGMLMGEEHGVDIGHVESIDNLTEDRVLPVELRPRVEHDVDLAVSLRGLTHVRHADRTGQVLMISSFSKALIPGVRIGYIVAGPQFLDRLVMAKQADDLCSPPLLQRALALFIQHGWLAAHLRRAIPRYRERRDALLTAMARSFPSGIHWTTPRGGLCTWVTLPAGTSVTDLYLAAIERGVGFAPGDVFFIDPPAQPFMRLSFSTLPPELITEAAQILGQLISVQTTRRAFMVPPLAECVPLV